MAINKFGDYEKTAAYTNIPQLPKGAYILKIGGAEVCENKNGQYIKISCDIAEGEYKGFFTNDYKAQTVEDKKWHCNYLLNVPKDDGSEQDGWTKRRFKTVMMALEDSNPGYHFDWDEKKFKGKVIGGLFNIREYKANDGSIRQATNLKTLCAVDDIKKGTFRMPKDDLMERPAAAPVSLPEMDADGFMKIPDTADDLPFSFE